MNKIPTAEEFAESNQYDLESHDEGGYLGIDTKVFAEKLKEFAKLHVKAALEAAANKATVTPIDHEEISEGSFRPIWGVDDDSILNAYPENLIV